MNAKQQNYLGLLEALKFSLSNNQFSKINIIVDDLIRRFIAYDDLKLDSNQSKIWDTLKETLEKDMANSRQVLNLSGSFGFTFNG